MKAIFLNENTKTEGSTETDAFTVYGLNEAGEVVETKLYFPLVYKKDIWAEPIYIITKKPEQKQLFRLFLFYFPVFTLSNNRSGLSVVM